MGMQNIPIVNLIKPMRKDDISRLLARYLSMQEEGKDVYFDADEIEDLLDSFEDSDDYTLYDGVLALGIKLHPDHPGLKIKQCKDRKSVV